MDIEYRNGEEIFLGRRPKLAYEKVFVLKKIFMYPIRDMPVFT